jgi:polyhydroxyalkanoate synthase
VPEIERERTGRGVAREARRALLRFVNGVEWMLRDPADEVGRTPYDEILRKGKLVVRRYRLGDAPARPRHAVPVLLIPPLMVKPFIFDLFPGRSMAEFLLEQGFAVYLVDFGEPEAADALVTLDDYVLDFMPSACEAAKADAGADEISLVGYCMGATFAFAHTAANDDASVRNIVDIASPVDPGKLGPLYGLMQAGAGQMERLVRLVGNIPGGISSYAFRMITPAKNVTRYADLFMNLWDREYVRGFDAMNQWISQFIDYPRDAYLQFSRDFVRENKLANGTLRFGDAVADLKKVRASLLVFGGRTDQVAPARAVEAILEMVESEDTSYRLAPGGHMGVFSGKTAPEHVWAPAAAWLAERSHAPPSA